MLYYCEKCHVLNEHDCCRSCGKKSLRNPGKGDYCFLIEADSMFGEMFIGILDDESISYTAIPSGNGVRSQFALKLENLKIYVDYEFFDRAKDLLDNILTNIEETQSKELKQNINMLFVPHRTEKKIKKTLKLAEDISIRAYCSDIIMNADRILNKGRISGCIKGGNYLFVYKGKELFIINSATYEIISAKRIT